VDDAAWHVAPARSDLTTQAVVDVSHDASLPRPRADIALADGSAALLMLIVLPVSYYWEVEVVVLDDDLSPDERVVLHASLDRALDDSEAGRAMDAAEYLSQHCARREGRPAR
jgi:hypothetical protein